MEDEKIIELLWQRSERAIENIDQKYGRFCFSISHRILNNTQDAEECVSDTYLAAWDQIPPTSPKSLSAFLGRITRNLSVSRWRSLSAQRRGGGEIDVALDELEECIAGPFDLEQEIARKELESAIQVFCKTLPTQDRIVFLKRYYFLSTIPEIAKEMGFSQPKVKSILHRCREKLKAQLAKEALYETN